MDAPRCFECDEPAEVEHHVVPRSRGGTRTVPLCGRCHGRAHHTDRNMSPVALIRDRVAQGKPHGRTPFGYRVENGRYVPVEWQMRVLALMERMRREGVSTTAVADALNRWGVPTQHGRRWRDAGVWKITGEPGRKARERVSRQNRV